MSYLVTVTFDLHEVPKNDWEQVYKEVYTALEKIGLAPTATTSKGKVVKLPESTVMGKVDGESVEKVRDEIDSDVKAVFKAQKRKYTMLVTVAARWAWLRSEDK